MLRRFARIAIPRHTSGLAALKAGSTGPFLRSAIVNPKTAAYLNIRPKTTIGKIDKPTYQLTFTCKTCDDRSSHLISKQAYHNGTVIVQCPSCKNRHLIADHLNILSDNRITIEDILAAKGEKVTKANVDLEKLGDIELEPEDLEAIETSRGKPTES